MTNREDRIKLLHEAAAERILVIGGPYGTYLHGRDLTPADYGGLEYDGCPEQLNITRPDVIADAHRGYLEAGADIIATNTFGGGSIVLAEVRPGRQGARDQRGRRPPLAQRRRFVQRAWAPRFVAGNLGPTTKSLSVTGGITFDEMVRVFHDWAKAFVLGGADLLALETQNDTRTIKAALIGINRVFDELGFRVPVIVSATIELTGTMLAGQTVDALAASLMHADLFAIGPELLDGPGVHDRPYAHARRHDGVPHVRWPNAGLPDEEGSYSETPADGGGTRTLRR